MRTASGICAHALGLAAALCIAHAHAAFEVVATTTDLKSLAETIGGERVAVVALVPPNTDPEEYQPKPQDLARLKTARMLLRVGVDFDLWVDRLAAQAGRPALRRGGEGHVDASFGIALLDVRGSQVGPAGGHAHGSGNPHYWLDPANAEMMTASILEALVRLDAANAEYYQQRRMAFLATLKSRIDGWQRRLAPVHGVALIAYHSNWSYLARRFRLNIVGHIEPRPGVPPPPAHLAALIRESRAHGVKAVVLQPQEPRRNAEFVAARAGVPIVLLAASVGALPQATDYLALIDHNVGALAALAH